VSDWPGRVALVLAAFVGGGWATALVLAATPWTDTISEQGANLLATVGGVLAGAVATYLGVGYGQRNPPSSDDRTPDTPGRDELDPP
jgi:hypothetical protein